MKDKIIMIILFFVLMATLPLWFIAKNAENDVKNKTGSSHSDPVNDFSNPYIAEVARLCGDDYCDEAVRALAIIAQTNSEAGKKAENTDYNSNKESYKRIERFCSDNSGLLCFKQKPVEIPVCKCSNGKTSFSLKLGYLSAVASPWDCFCGGFSPSAESDGVSAYGIDHLCKSGMSAEEALRWYLPKLDLVLDNR